MNPTSTASVPVKVAVHEHFLDAFADLQRPTQKKVSEFLRKFRENPRSAAINYEKISDFRDPNLRTVRIDLAYRAIVLAPERGDVYVLLWVDHHDEAMAWARRRRVEVNPETGALQVFAVETLAAAPVAAPSGATVPPGDTALFAAFRDRELLRIGVPEAALPRVRGLESRAALDAARGELPSDAWEALAWLADGEPLADVERVLAEGRAVGEDVDGPPVSPLGSDDFAAALEAPASRRAFRVVTDDASLAAMLDAPLEKWRVFLHPSQRKLVQGHAHGPVRVLGGAGTGKTVVAMHRAVRLAETLALAPGERILFTTFTRNLALEIRHQLATLAPPAIVAQIEVVHLDRLVADLLREAGYPHTIAYPGNDARLATAWTRALSAAGEGAPTAEAFFRDEWTAVILPQNCRTWEQYRDAHRGGRGTRVSRQQRLAAWPVFATYRELLERQRLREPEDAQHDAADLLRAGTIRKRYRAAVVDEAQDMGTAAFALLRRLVPEGDDDLFIVGDGHQRIYKRQTALRDAGISIVGRAHRLRINYRTTEEIRRFAVGLLEGCAVDDLDGGDDHLQGYRSLTHGQAPVVQSFERAEDEFDAIAAFIAEDPSARSCVVTRTQATGDTVAKALSQRGLVVRPISRDTHDDASVGGVRVATMHRVKGLEFDRVVLAGAGESAIPLRVELDATDDPAIREEVEQRERALLYVTLTRARRAVLVTTTGRPSPWLSSVATR
jgi:superfamily I DNA/RNA helicase